MADPAYQIKDWDKVFEDFRSREVDRLSFVKFPLDRKSEAYSLLMQSKRGVFAYGMFCSIVAIAARCPRRGLLVDDRGPLTPARLAVRIGSPCKVVTEGISILSGRDIGWLIETTDWELPQQRSSTDSSSTEHRPPTDTPPQFLGVCSSSSSSSVPGESVRGAASGFPAGEYARGSSGGLSGRFNVAELQRVFELYPKRTGAVRARAAIDAALCAITTRGMDEPAAIEFLTGRVRAFAAAVNGGPLRFVPNPATWFDEGRYDDDPATWKREKYDEDAPTTAIGKGGF